MQKAPVLAFSLIALLILPVITLMLTPSFSQTAKGAYIDQARFIERSDENLALEEVKSGSLDAYYFRIPLESAGDLKNDQRVKSYDRLAGSAGLLFNPAPAEDGDSLNPFELRDVRYAMNYLIDRKFIVDEILNGYGSPMVEPYGIYSPEYLNIIDVVESFGFRHNPGLAEKMITDALASAGATKEDGKWMYNGNQITVKILIRSDDAPRKSIGEDVASKLEGLGFAVQKDYGDLRKANGVVYGSDPQDFQWHIYTESFAGTSVFVKNNPLTVGQMYGPWYGALPGAQNPDFWNYQNSTIDELTQRIFFFNFTSQAERDDLVRQAVRAGVEESVRIFLVQKTEPFVASSSLQGMVNDFGAGITSKYSLLNARPAEDNSIDIGSKLIHQGAWNTIGGLNDAYSRDIFYSVIDTGTFRNPYTGEIIPMRAEWTEVSTEGPLERLPVAEDARLWNPAAQQWKEVGPDAMALSKAKFKLLYSNWHHGVPMDMSDILFVQYFAVEWGTDLGAGDMTKDPEYTSQQSAALPYAKGIKFTAPDEVESYTDIWHYDETEIADSASMWSVEPWEITAATERLVKDGKVAYSRSEATGKNVDWLDLLTAEHAQLVREELQKMKGESFVPPALADIVSVDDAIKRYDASIKWIADHSHAIIGNGAFYLDTYNSAGRTITVKAFRDDSYPFEVGHWSKFETPLLADIRNVNAGRSITIGQPATVTVSVTVDGQPSNDAIVNYFILDKDGIIAAKGEGAPAAGTAGEFQIDLAADETSKLSPGPNQLRIFANSKFAFRPDISENTILAAASSIGNSTPTTTTTTPTGQNGTTTPDQPSGCLIATAAFGSELTPQVQYLRNFREQYILSTVSGSAFMSAFNSVYYSFSPQVADYERGQPWLQAVVKTGLYPLFGILNLSERAHFAVNGGELGAVAAGATASMLIGAVYLWPAAVSGRVQSRFGTVAKVSIAVLAATAALMAIGIVASAPQLLVVSTSLFVLAAASLSAMAVGRLVRRGLRVLTRGKY